VEIKTLKATPQRGGNRHPLSTRQFVIDYLVAKGEASIPELHDAYKILLQYKAGENRQVRTKKGKAKVRPYHWARYGSFKTQVLKLIKEGIIEPSGRQEPATSERFKYWENKPLLRFYKIKS